MSSQYIFGNVDKIRFLTDTMVASVYYLAMMQFFVCTEGKLNIKVGKEQPDAKCILANKIRWQHFIPVILPL